MGRFDTTRWSLVLRARGDPAGSRAALETLCRIYRPPVLAFVRSRGYPPDAAEDLTQAFFTRFLERGWYGVADPQRGRFRSFLLVVLKRFLADSARESTRVKRGGGYRFESFDEGDASDPQAENTPESEFERAWAHAVLGAAIARLRGEAEQAGKLPLFQHLSEFLLEPPDDADYERVAKTLNLRRNTLAVSVHRLRHRLRELVREELRETTASQDELEAELRVLRGAMWAMAPDPCM